MTTDLSQLHPQNAFPQATHPPDARSEDDPQKDFSTPKSGYSTAYWVAAGAGVLIATGVAAFTSFKNVPDPASGLATAPAISTESEAAAHAVFGEDEPELAAAEAAVAEPAPRDPASPAAAVAPPESAAADSEGIVEAAAPASDPPAADALPAATPGAYYVQLASYRTKEIADTHAKELAARGFSAQSFAYGGPSAGWWHAVRLGPFQDRVLAEKSRFDLEVLDRRAAYVLPRSNGKFHVQVASFAEQEEAEKVAKSFTAAGHATKVTRVKMSGTHWHCVRIGPFDTREEAVAYKALVPDVPGSQSTVIPFPPPPAR